MGGDYTGGEANQSKGRWPHLTFTLPPVYTQLWKPPTEDQLNEEVDDGYGLQFKGEPSWFIQAELDLKEAELDALEVTNEMTTDRWEKEEKFLLSMVRSYELSLEFELEWQDEIDPNCGSQGAREAPGGKGQVRQGEEGVRGREGEVSGEH
jgi:hypothetical protein